MNWKNHRLVLKHFFFFVFLAACQISSAQSPSLNERGEETAEFSRVLAVVESEMKRVGTENLLFVVDIDNTLLAMDQDLGSDQWFGWQSELLKTEAMSVDLVASDFPGLLRVQGVLFSLGQMHPPEPELSDLVEKIKSLCGASVVLTSRGPEFRNAAERELERNGFRFRDLAMPISEPVRGRFKPFDPTKPGAHGLSAKEMKALGSPRDVTYSEGIMMTAGQHKGFMLRTLLARSGRRFSSIVFVDDSKKNIRNMLNGFRGQRIKVIAFRYSREDGDVAKFENSDKRHVVDGWNALQQSMRHSLVH